MTLATTPTGLVNISSRGQVQTADQVMIGGFVISDQSAKVIVRAIGPSLRPLNVVNALQDPTLSVFNIQGDRIFDNDNWKETQRTDIEATLLAPIADAESAIVATLTPGSYTAIVRGANDSTGVALVEIYSLE